MANERQFEPLINSIERTLAALDNRSNIQEMDAAADELRTLYNDYVTCCCRRAHVIKDEPLA